MSTLFILVRLLTAHVVADFFLQWKHLVIAKNSTNHLNSFLALLVHSLIHGTVTYIFLAQWDNWLLPLIIFLTHFLIDLFKVRVMKNDNLWCFVIDQLLHIGVIILVWLLMFFQPFPLNTLLVWICNEALWIKCLAYLIILKPTAIMFDRFFRRWAPIKGSGDEGAHKPTDSLLFAGKWIGYLERVLILSFIFMGQVQLVGYLLAAKSIFRFGDLRNPLDIKHTEYVLVGTLASFTVACLVGGLAQWALLP